MIDYFESFVFSIEIAEICIFQVMNSIVCNANKENCSHITQTMQFYTQTVFRQFSMSKIILRKFLVIWGKQQEKKNILYSFKLQAPICFSSCANGFPGIFRIFSTVSYSYLRVILENSKPSQMLACVRGVFKFQSNIYDRAFLQNQLTAKSRSLFLEKKLKCLLFKVKFPGQHLLIKINGNSRTMSEIASKLIKTQHNKVKT